MDLGIAGRTAIVCASTRGLGRGCAEALVAAGCTVVVNGRTQEAAEKAAAEIGTGTIPVGADVGTPEGRAALLAAAPAPDILVNNNAGPPFRDFREIDEAALLQGVEANMAAPIALVRAVVDGMVERGFGRIVNITSGSVKAPIAGLDLSSGARAGLTGFLAGVARSVAHGGVTINFLLPGAFDTDRLRSGQQVRAEAMGVSLEQARAGAVAGIPARRFGTPEEFGAACAFLCSAHAGFITGQSLLMDGGAYPGVL
jgi:3-oxoacyl-[acyl-carrier protein] reductase